MLVRQTCITFDQQEIIKQFKMENFFNELTSSGKNLVNDRIWAFKKFPRDPKIIKCTRIPGQGWDLTENEARQFINLINGKIKDVSYQSSLDIIIHESDMYEYIWIVFE
jgi:hypothetical protein